MKHHLHGPCNPLYCSTKGRCRFNFPFEFSKVTTYNDKGWVLWHRPNDGRMYVRKIHSDEEPVVFTNRDVSPYCPKMLRKYKCHLHIDLCSLKISSIRYLFDYMLKGEDLVTVRLKQKKLIKEGLLDPDNKIELYVNGR